ncbi:MAG: hypothetical protein KF812_04870 [Fimbriimonadaceae bacterium]|nr:hypothetical protein [Fimbriimonadaceae bacterium]
MLDPSFLAILACPKCDDRPPLTQTNESELLCPVCGARYPIEDGIPNLLVDDLEPPSDSTTAQP